MHNDNALNVRRMKQMGETQLAEATQSIHKLQQELANFIAVFEQTETKFEERQQTLNDVVSEFERRVSEQLVEMDAALAEIAEVMTSSGAARWRVAAETAMKEGAIHSQRILELTDNFEKLGTEKFDRLDKLTLDSEKRFAKALNLLTAGHQESLNEFQSRVTKAYEEVENASKKALKEFQQAKKWGKWEGIN